MELHARLVHAEAGLRVVEVRATRGAERLGSALAEAPTAQAAEDLAVARLLQRLGAGDSPAARPDPGAGSALRLPATAAAVTAARRSADGPSQLISGHLQDQGEASGAAASPARRTVMSSSGSEGLRRDADRSAAAAQPELAFPARKTGSGIAATRTAAADPSRSSLQPPQASAAAPPPLPSLQQKDQPVGVPLQEETPVAPAADPQEEPPADPEDWSQELTAVDLELRRLGWSREQEGLYLQRAFGHPSRSRLTRYSDLRAYLIALEGLERGSDPAVAAVPLRRSELLAQGDALLSQLGWSAEQGREFLERQLNRISRQQLSDVQLLQFNMLLEGELLSREAPAAMAAPDGSQR